MDISSDIRGVKGLFLTALFLLLLTPAKGQLISVQSLLSRDSLMIGEQINYTLRVEAATELEFILPSIQDTLSSTLEVISQFSTDTSVFEGRTVV